MTSLPFRNQPVQLGHTATSRDDGQSAGLLVSSYSLVSPDLEQLIDDVKARRSTQGHACFHTESLAKSLASPWTSSWAGPWMMTLTDLTMLTLAFFVLLYSMQTPVSASLKSPHTALSRSENPRFDTPLTPSHAALNAAPIRRLPSGSLAYVSSIIDRGLRQDPRLDNARIERRNGEVRIKITSQNFFDGELPRLSEQAIPQIVALSRLLGTLRNQIEIEMLTWQRVQSPQTGRTSTGWSQALARGAAFARALKIAGYTKPIFVKVVSPSSDIPVAHTGDFVDLALILKAYDYGS